jgi:pyrimidine-nucleoside phosphorylase
MNVPSLIRKKRDGATLETEEIREFVPRFTRGEIPDYQCSALLMAIYFRGLDARETADLTAAMMVSGRVLDFSEFPQPKIDKHSTGGVGDKTSLILGPAGAAGGLVVPMISGRGLGHTGGTLDKLESIPGFNVRLSIREFRRILQSCGLGLIGQTEELAPADRKLYSLRDVTATVESIPLIAASIMSKKLAEGIDGLVLDVKTGSGAFMKRAEDSRHLAEMMVSIGKAHKKKMKALVTDMNQPLGRAVGNALEVIECVEALKGKGPADLVLVTRELTAQMFVLGGVDHTPGSARARFDAAVGSGAALERLARVIAEQGGDPRVIDDYSRLPKARYKEDVLASTAGYIAALEAEAIGHASMMLGAGRERMDSIIDHAAGITLDKKVGDRVDEGERICVLSYNEPDRLPSALNVVRAAIRISSEPVTPPALVVDECS